jgi:dihydroorotate dehydrogenase electron transfer subunit
MEIPQRACQPQAELHLPVVTAVRDLSRGLFVLDLEGFPDSFQPRPGQFLHIRLSQEDHPLLRRPISIQSYKRGVVSLLIREVGMGTRILHEKRIGEFLDVLGPLGTTFTLPQPGERVLMVGGGVGVAPLLACCEESPPGAQVDFCYGVATASEIQGLEPFQGREGEIRFHISTDDGSAGTQGFCTDLAAPLAEQYHYSRILTCGPWVMMKKAFELAQAKGLPIAASLEVQMGCGLGACLGCVYETPEGDFLRSCIDGPVVDGYGVVWEKK